MWMKRLITILIKNKHIINNIYGILSDFIFVKNKNNDLETKDYYSSNIIYNKIYWISTRNFCSENSNKRFFNNEGYMIMNYMSNLLGLIKFNYVKIGNLQDINFYIEMNKLKKVDIIGYKDIYFKKENRFIRLYNPIEDYFIFNYNLENEIKKIRLKMIKIKDKNMKWVFESKIENIKNVINL